MTTNYPGIVNPRKEGLLTIDALADEVAFSLSPNPAKLPNRTELPELSPPKLVYAIQAIRLAIHRGSGD